MFRSCKARKNRLALALASCALASGGQSHAETEAIRIEYRAATGCPSANKFTSRVLRRARNARLASGAERARTFVVAIKAVAAGFSGSVTIHEVGSVTVARTLVGARCGEVADVLALSTILAIDPSAPPSNERESDKAWSEPEPEAEPAPEARPAPPVERDVTPTASAHGAEARAATPSRAPWSHWVRLGPDLQLGATPRAAIGASLGFEARRSGTGALLGALGAEVTFLQSLNARVSGASASFQLLFVRPQACLSRLRVSGPVFVAPCVAAELGVVTATGSDIPLAQTERRFWAAAELPLRLQAALSSDWELELDAALAVTLTRYRFYFEAPDTDVHQASALGFRTGIQLGTRL